MILLQISSGNGPEECAFAVSKTLEKLIKEAEASNIGVKIIEYAPSRVAGNYASVLLGIEGDEAASFACSWEGSVQWVFKSAYRPHHKRKNWFVGVSVYTPEKFPEFSEKDVRYETTFAAGPGG